MEKLTLGLEIKFQAHVAIWLLFYKNAQENSQQLPDPGHMHLTQLSQGLQAGGY